MNNWFRNLSISKKLYTTIGIMATLIVIELITLVFSLKVLSSVRAYVEAEGLWSKSQKDASLNLEHFVRTGNISNYNAFQKQIAVPLGFKIARLELNKHDPDLNLVQSGFLQGGVHAEDVNRLIWLYENLGWNSYLKKAINIWVQGDVKIDELLQINNQLLQEKQKLITDQKRINNILELLEKNNRDLSLLEENFSTTLGDGSRWLENIIKKLLLLLTVSVEITGLTLAYTISKNIKRGLGEITKSAIAISNKDFTIKAKVLSNDEIGTLAILFNRMSDELKNAIYELKDINEEYSDKTHLLNEAQELAKLGSWQFKIEDEIVTGSKELFKIFELDARDKNTLADFLKIIHPEDVAQVSSVIDNAIKTKEKYNIHYRIIAADNKIKFVHGLGNPILNKYGNVFKLIGTIQDETEIRLSEINLKKEAAYIKLLSDIATEANNSNSFEKTVRYCMNGIADLTGWPLAHVYFRSPENKNKLIASDIWHISNNQDFKPFIDKTESSSFPIGIGLPGLILKSRKPIWVKNLQNDPTFFRKDVAKDCGIVSGFGLPILSGEEVLSVIEFFSLYEIEEDARFYKIMYNISNQIGRVAERKAAIDALLIKSNEIKSIVDTAYDAFIMIDEEGYIIDWNYQAENIFGWERSEAIGRSINNIILHEDDRERHLASMLRFTRKHKGKVLSQRFELAALRKNGKKFPIELTIAAIKREKGYVFASLFKIFQKGKKQKKKLTRPC